MCGSAQYLSRWLCVILKPVLDYYHVRRQLHLRRQDHGEEALSRGSTGHKAAKKFIHCCPSLSLWISAILGLPALKSTWIHSFLPGHHEKCFFLILVLKKKCLGSVHSDQLCMSAAHCLCRAGGIWQFVEHLLSLRNETEKAGWIKHVLRSLGVCLVLTLQTEDQSSTASLRSANSPRLLVRQRSTSASFLHYGENLLASSDGNKSGFTARTSTCQYLCPILQRK